MPSLCELRHGYRKQEESVCYGGTRQANREEGQEEGKEKLNYKEDTIHLLKRVVVHADGPYESEYAEDIRKSRHKREECLIADLYLTVRLRAADDKETEEHRTDAHEVNQVELRLLDQAPQTRGINLVPPILRLVLLIAIV